MQRPSSSLPSARVGSEPGCIIRRRMRATPNMGRYAAAFLSVNYPVDLGQPVGAVWSTSPEVTGGSLRGSGPSRGRGAPATLAGAAPATARPRPEADQQRGEERDHDVAVRQQIRAQRLKCRVRPMSHSTIPPPERRGDGVEDRHQYRCTSLFASTLPSGAYAAVRITRSPPRSVPTSVGRPKVTRA